MKDWVLTKAAFDRLLNWLDVDREAAALKYELLRRRLVKYFVGHHCAAAEDLADDVINRVIGQLDRQPALRSDKPLPYIFGIARNVYRHYLGEQMHIDGAAETQRLPNQQRLEDELEKERLSRCLHECLQKLQRENRQLLLRYYLKETDAKAQFHEHMAKQLDCTLNALRLKMMRLRERLRDCITLCVQQG